MEMVTRIEEEITALRGSGALAATFRRCKEQGEGLRSFADAEALIAFLRDPEAGPQQRKDAALAALCVQAMSGDQRVATLLLWLLLPGLLHVRSGLAGRDALEAQDLDAELVIGLWEAATKVVPQSRDVAARLVNGARWRALTAIREAIDWQRRSEPLDWNGAELPEREGGAFGSPGILTQAVREGVITEDEVELILVFRQTSRDVGPRLGVTLCTARQRKRRARLRLIEWLGKCPVSPDA
jgi:DNA-directed RNA polymerase specialized sigma24 family protein